MSDDQRPLAVFVPEDAERIQARLRHPSADRLEARIADAYRRLLEDVEAMREDVGR